MRRYHDIPVNICVEAETREEAEIIAYLFMPWTYDSGRTWNLQGHKNIGEYAIDNWVLLGVDDEKMEGVLRERLWR